VLATEKKRPRIRPKRHSEKRVAMAKSEATPRTSSLSGRSHAPSTPK
jgi:hypothetical protein